MVSTSSPSGANSASASHDVRSGWFWATVLFLAAAVYFTPRGILAAFGGLAGIALVAWLLWEHPWTLLCAVVLPAIGLGAMGTVEFSGGTFLAPSLFLVAATILPFLLLSGLGIRRLGWGSPLFLPYAIYWAAVFFTVLPSVSVLHWARGLVEVTLGYGFFLFPYVYMKTQRELRLLLRVLVGLAIFTILCGYLEHWFYDSFAGIVPLVYPQSLSEAIDLGRAAGRMVGNWVYYSDFGSILNLLAPLVLYFCVSAKKNWLWPLLLFLLLGSGIFLTATRAITLAFGASALVFCLLVKQHRSRILVPAVALVGLLVFTPLFSDALSRFDFSRPENLISIENRALMRLEALGFFLQNPVLGIGFRNFPDRVTFDPHVATHNVYFEQAAETGSVGLLAFLYLLYRALRLEFTAAKKRLPQGLQDLSYALFCGALAIAIESLAQNSFYVWQIWCLFWLNRGISAAIAARPQAFERTHAVVAA